MKESKSQALGLSGLVVFFVGWILYGFDIYLDPRVLLPRDNTEVNFEMFSYMSQWIRYFGTFPNWFFSRNGGVWLEPLTNNYQILLPYRAIGYLFVQAFSIPDLLAYKIAFLLVGNGFFAWGLWLLGGQIFGPNLFRLLFVFTAMVTAMGLGSLHQEQVMATQFYVPFACYLLFRARENAFLFVPFASLVGLSFTIHYPQLQVGFWFCILFSLVLCWEQLFPQCRRLLGVFRQGKGIWLVVLAVFAFLISAGPLFYSYFKFRNSLSSNFRGQSDGIAAIDYEQYVNLRDMGSSSLLPSNALSYLQEDRPFSLTMGRADNNNLFAGIALPFVLLLLPWFGFAGRRFYFFLSLFLGLFSIGIHGPIPFLLWGILPGISLFRQWYHFTTLLNLSLVALSLLTLRAYLGAVALSTWQRRGLALCAVGLLVSLFCDFLSPLATLPPLACILLRFASKKWPKGMSLEFGLLIGWLLLGNLPWMKRALEDIRQISYRIQNSQDYSQALGKSLLTDGALVARQALANPKGFDAERAASLGAFRMSFWRSKEGGLSALESGAFRVSPERGGLKISFLKIPKGAVSLIWSQYNDGLWEARSSSLEWPGLTNSHLKTVEIPLTPGMEWVWLRHSYSLWHLLIVLMWLPLIASGVTFFLIAKRRRGVFRWGYRSPAVLDGVSA